MTYYLKRAYNGSDRKIHSDKHCYHLENGSSPTREATEVEIDQYDECLDCASDEPRKAGGLRASTIDTCSLCGTELTKALHEHLPECSEG